MFVVCVEFTTKSACFDAFLELIKNQAHTSLASEPECHQFDVCQGNGETIFLYELYSDKSAFDAHLETSHFKQFDQDAKDMVLSKSVKTYQRVH